MELVVSTRTWASELLAWSWWQTGVQSLSVVRCPSWCL